MTAQMPHGRFAPCRILRHAAILWLATLGVHQFVHAQDRGITDLRVSRTGDVATAELMLACRAGVLDSEPLSDAGELRIRLTLHPGCVQALGGGARDERHRPPSGELARIEEVAFESSGAGEAVVTVRFDAITSVSVSQGVRRDSITLEIDVNNVVAELPEAENPVPTIEAPAPLPAEPVAGVGSILGERRAQSDAQLSEREPIGLVERVETGDAELFAVQLAAGAAPPIDGLHQRVAAERLHIYVNERTAGGRTWQELRVGFFEEEVRAREFLVQIADLYPDAVVVVADDGEQRASGARVAGGAGGRAQTDIDAALAAIAQTTLEEQFDAAREALLSGDHARAIELLGRLASEPGFERREQSLEMLGVAHERNGDMLQAQAAYRTYLASRPEGPDAMRVRQRLAALITVVDADASRSVSRPNTGTGLWDVRGGIAQYYRDDRIRIFEDEPAEVTQSAFLSHVDLSARREGERLDFVSRVNGAFVYDVLDDDDGSEDQALVSRAYVGVVDKDKDRGIRLGRQSLYRSGVLGRFDGAAGHLRVKPRVVMNLAAGSPVDSPRSSYSDRRQFLSVSADLEQFVGRWDISVFSLMQQVDGIADRQAVGGEAQYRGDNWHVLTALDLDPSFGEVNSVLVAANWQAADKLTFNTRVDFHVAPFVMTRNAIIGQSVGTVEDMLDLYTEREIRQFARDRSATARSASLGFSWALFDRFQMDSDVTYLEYDEFPASAGVDAIPASDPQLFFSLNFVGSSLFGGGDTAIFGLRHSQTRTAETAGIVFDFRLPMGQRIRINPRLAVTSRKYWVDWSTELFVEPTLRLLMRFRQQHRFEVELGALWSSRALRSNAAGQSAPDQETSARFFNLGYLWEF